MAYPLDLEVQIACDASIVLPSVAEIRTWLEATFSLPAVMTVRFVDEEEAKALNEQYRQKAYPTNVLTFPYEQEPVCVADLVICPMVVEREAIEQRKPLIAHYAHLIVHGALHAQGWDHEVDGEAEDMEAKERLILATLNFDDPYRDDTLG